jgi:hypothetical protein
LLVESNLSEAARKAIEMQPGLEKFYTDAQRRNFARGQAKGEAIALLKISLRPIRSSLGRAACQKE